MYSTNINQQQDGQQQAPDVKPDSKDGGKYIINIEDVVTDNGRSGLSIYIETVKEPDYETPAYCVAKLLKEVIAHNTDTIGEVMVDAINRNQKDQQ